MYDFSHVDVPPRWYSIDCPRLHDEASINPMSRHVLCRGDSRCASWFMNMKSPKSLPPLSPLSNHHHAWTTLKEASTLILFMLTLTSKPTYSVQDPVHTLPPQKKKPCWYLMEMKFVFWITSALIFFLWVFLGLAQHYRLITQVIELI